MKRISLFMTALLLIILSSCSPGEMTVQDEAMSPAEITANEKYKMSDLEDGAYYLGENTLAVFPYKDKLYKVGYELGYYDLSFGMVYTSLCDFGGDRFSDVYVDDRGIYCYDGAVILVFAHDGISQTEYRVADGKTKHYQVQVTGTDDYILACGSRKNGSDMFESYVFTVERATGAVSEYVISEKNTLDTLLAFEPGSKTNTAVMFRSDSTEEIMMMGGESVYAVYTFDAAKGKLSKEYTYDFAVSGADYVAEDDCFYGMFRNIYLTFEGSFRLASSGFGETEFTGYRNISGTSAFAPVKSAVEAAGGEVQAMSLEANPCHFFTGFDYICLDSYNNTVCVFSGSPAAPAETLTVLYLTQTPQIIPDFNEPAGHNLDSAVIRPNLEFEESNKVTVKTKTYDLAEFSDRLRMKLLAGDRDYDIVYLDQAGELLPHILRYGLYLPLEGYSEINTSFDNYIDGVRDVMSYDGHIYGVPYALGGMSLAVQDDYHELGLPKLEGAYSFDDFWRVCEEMKNSPNGDVLTIDFHLFRQLMKSVVEDGAEKGVIDEEAVYETVSKFMEYRDAEVITPWINRGSFLLGHIYTFSTPGVKMTDYKSSFCELIPYPSYSGKTYVPVESVIYANSLTENTDLSVKYLAMLMTKDYAAEAASGKSNLWKEKSDYFMFGSYALNTKALVEACYEPPVKPYSFGEYDSYLLDNGSTALINPAPNLYSEMLDELFYSVFKELAAGNVTAKEAADQICREVNYRIME